MMITKGTRVAIVDDVTYYAENAAGIAEEAGLVPSVITEGSGPFDETDQLLEIVQNDDCDAVICDHRLSQTAFASFTGAEFVSRMYEQQIPGILISTFSAIDSDTSIRIHRANIPSVIGRAQLDPDLIRVGLNRCKAELNGEITPERLPRRTLVRVMNISTDSDIPIVEAILHSWDPDRAIRFPITLIKNEQIKRVLSTNLPNEVRLFSEVNVGCTEESELFFRAFEIAPEPDINELES